jgi:LacI family transcriptional regulator
MTLGRKSGVSLSEVAQRSGVSTTTASMVLSNRWREFRITPATRDQVIAVADELGYTPRRPSKARNLTRSRLWAIFSPTDFDTGPTGEFHRGVLEYVRGEGLDIETIIFPFERGRLQEKADWITAKFAAGAIFLGLGEDDVAFLENQDIDIPIVLANRVAKNWPSVVTDDYEVGNLVLRHFAARGLTSMAMVVPEYSTRSQSLRVVGFADGYSQLLRRDEPGSPDRDVPQARARNDYEGGRAAILELLPELNERTGIFVLNDSMVGGVMHALQESGRSIPEDVEIVSYGNGSINTILRPTVTSVAVPVAQMSFDCARALHQAISLPAGIGHLTRTLDVSLALRASSPAPLS